MSVDGAADIGIEGHPHGDGVVHELDSGQLNSQDQTADSDRDSDHCERCCHGHTASITSQVASVTQSSLDGDLHIQRSPHVRNFAQAPPTPPPNA